MKTSTVVGIGIALVGAVYLMSREVREVSGSVSSTARDVSGVSDSFGRLIASIGSLFGRNPSVTTGSPASGTAPSDTWQDFNKRWSSYDWKAPLL